MCHESHAHQRSSDPHIPCRLHSDVTGSAGRRARVLLVRPSGLTWPTVRPCCRSETDRLVTAALRGSIQSIATAEAAPR